MVFIRKINDYYVLAHSQREGSKVLQKTRYLGKSIPPKPRLEQLKKEFLKELSGERYRYLSIKDVEDIDRKRQEYDSEIAKLSSLERKKQFQELKSFIKKR